MSINNARYIIFNSDEGGGLIDGGYLKKKQPFGDSLNYPSYVRLNRLSFLHIGDMADNIFSTKISTAVGTYSFQVW